MASVTIFWMLLLSSATRILATNRPPAIPHPCTPRQPLHGHTGSPSPMYWSTRLGRRQRQRVKRVSEMNTVPQPPELPLLTQNKRGAERLRTPHFTSRSLSLTAPTRERSSSALSFSCCSILSSCPLLRHSGCRSVRAQHLPWPHRWAARGRAPHPSWELLLPPLLQPPGPRHSPHRRLLQVRRDLPAPPSLACSRPPGPPRFQPRRRFHCCPPALPWPRSRFPSRIFWFGPRRSECPPPMTHRIPAPTSVLRRVKQLAIPVP